MIVTTRWIFSLNRHTTNAWFPALRFRLSVSVSVTVSVIRVQMTQLVFGQLAWYLSTSRCFVANMYSALFSACCSFDLKWRSRACRSGIANTLKKNSMCHRNSVAKLQHFHKWLDTGRGGNASRKKTAK